MAILVFFDLFAKVILCLGTERIRIMTLFWRVYFHVFLLLIHIAFSFNVQYNVLNANSDIFGITIWANECPENMCSSG